VYPAQWKVRTSGKRPIPAHGGGPEKVGKSRQNPLLPVPQPRHCPSTGKLSSSIVTRHGRRVPPSRLLHLYQGSPCSSQGLCRSDPQGVTRDPAFYAGSLGPALDNHPDRLLGECRLSDRPTDPNSPEQGTLLEAGADTVTRNGESKIPWDYAHWREGVSGKRRSERPVKAPRRLPEGGGESPLLP